jgi:hypothetical protein
VPARLRDQLGDRQVADLDEVSSRARKLDRLVRDSRLLYSGSGIATCARYSRSVRSVLGEERLDRGRELLGILDEAEVIRVRDPRQGSRRGSRQR